MYYDCLLLCFFNVSFIQYSREKEYKINIERFELKLYCIPVYGGFLSHTWYDTRCRENNPNRLTKNSINKGVIYEKKIDL